MGWKFWTTKKPLTIGDVPHFQHPFCVAWFKQQLTACDLYIEFGSGGSTVLAAEMGVPTVTVESDAVFLGLVKDKLAERGLLNEARNVYVHKDIGPVGPWGRPQKPKNPRLFEAFRNYSELPIASLENETFFVLVDGRFRVASALKTARLLAGKKGKLVIDDYLGRAEYRVVENFLRLDDLVGPMAVFSLPESGILRGEVFEEILRCYELDFR